MWRALSGGGGGVRHGGRGRHPQIGPPQSNVFRENWIVRIGMWIRAEVVVRVGAHLST